MKWNQDDRMLLMLYGEKSLSETIASMKKVRSSLEEDETELDRMLANVIRKLQQISEKEYVGMRM
jgi:sensor histidine kinase regulating citrate/malate metabolism